MINGVTVYNWLHYFPNDVFTFNGKQYNRMDPYISLAAQYGWANYFFQTNQGPSMPAHQFLLSGTSAPTAPPQPLFEAENPDSEIYTNGTGCTASWKQTVKVIDAKGSESDNPPVYPCFDHNTLTDLLDTAGLGWKYYSISTGSIWTAPNAIEHICQPNDDAPIPICVGKDWVNDVQPYLGTGKVLADLGMTGSCGLPAVSWVVPDGNWSDHAGLMSNGNAFGPAWVADIVDAVAGYDNTGAKLTTQCNYWQNTAILITWDDWGGWYDHVEPFNILINGKTKCDVWGCGYVYGCRVPFIFVSAYTPQGFVSGTVSGNGNTCPQGAAFCYDFGSILRFIELNFNLTEIAEHNFHYADFFANALDPTFYSGQFRQFQPILTPMPPTCFINPGSQGCIPNYTGPVDPDDDAIEPSN